MKIPVERLKGRTVITSDGLAIGEIDTLFLDGTAWRIASLRVRLRKEVADRLGAEHSLFRAGFVEIPIRMVQSAGDAVVLSVPEGALRQVLPEEVEPEPTP